MPRSPRARHARLRTSSSTVSRVFAQVSLVSLVFGPSVSAQLVETLASTDPHPEARFGVQSLSVDLFGCRSRPGEPWTAVASPQGNVYGQLSAGMVEFYAPPSLGMAPNNSVKLTAPPAHIRHGARFGASMAAGYIDADEHIDLVVGAPDAYEPGVSEGRVFVFFGPWSREGRTPYAAVTVLRMHQDDLGRRDEPLAEFGFSLAVGDLDNSFGQDIVVGMPHATDASDSNDRVADTGAVDVFLSVPKGEEGVTRTEHLYQPGPPDSRRHQGNGYGWSVAIGQFGNTRYTPVQDIADIAVGVPFWSTYGDEATGLVVVHYGHRNPNLVWRGESMGGVRFWNIVLAGAQREGDMYRGWSLAAADYDEDGWTELAIGCPGDLPEWFLFRGGHVEIASRDPDKMKLTIEGLIYGWQSYLRGTARGNLFGYSLEWVDYDGTGSLDLAVGIPLEDPSSSQIDWGAVYVIHSEVGVGPYYWSGELLVNPLKSARSGFGASLSRAVSPGKIGDDLLVGLPLGGVAEVPRAGLIARMRTR